MYKSLSVHRSIQTRFSKGQSASWGSSSPHSHLGLPSERPFFVRLTRALHTTCGLLCSPPPRSTAQAAGGPREAGGPSLTQKTWYSQSRVDGERVSLEPGTRFYPECTCFTHRHSQSTRLGLPTPRAGGTHAGPGPSYQQARTRQAETFF